MTAGITVLTVAGAIAAIWAVSRMRRETSEIAKNRPPQLPQNMRSSARPIYSKRLLSTEQIAMADLIVDAANAAGVNAPFMLALAVTESSLNPRAVGDDGLSVGLFQLNKKFIQASDAELKDPDFNTDAAMNKMALLMRSFPGNSYGDYAEAWALGGARRFRKMRRLPDKLTNMATAIEDLQLTLSLTGRAS
jgi:hypothetical protein